MNGRGSRVDDFDDPNALYDVIQGSKLFKEELQGALDALGEFVEEYGYGVDAFDFKDDAFDLKDWFVEEKDNDRIRLRKIIDHIIHPVPLLKKRLFNKWTDFELFLKLNNRDIDRESLLRTVPNPRDNTVSAIAALEQLSSNKRYPLAEQLVTAYHNSGLPINEFIAECPLCDEMRQSESRKARHVYDYMERYLEAYQRLIAHPLPMDAHILSDAEVEPYSDDIGVVCSYIKHMTRVVNSIGAVYSLLLNVYFVEPALAAKHKATLSESKQILFSRHVSPDTLFRTMREALLLLQRDGNLCQQQLVFLLMRSAPHDILVIHRPEQANYIWGRFDIEYLNLSKGPITPRDVASVLSSSDEGVLGVSYHLKDATSNKMYVSYGRHSSRVDPRQVARRLLPLFPIDTILPPDMQSSAVALRDNEQQRGQYWFSVAKCGYSCFDPCIDEKNPRGKDNVFVSKEATDRLRDYVREPFESSTNVYYFLDWMMTMQFIDQQLIGIQRSDPVTTVLMLMNTGLHRGSDGQALYSVMVRNNEHSKQRWKLKYTYDEEEEEKEAADKPSIGDAFMTADELFRAYEIAPTDLPRASLDVHDSFRALKKQLRVTHESVRDTKWYALPVSKRGAAAPASGGAINVKNQEFAKYVATAIETRLQQSNAIYIAQVTLKKKVRRLAVESLMPVLLERYNKYAVAAFAYDATSKKVRATRIYLDIVDLRNRASLVSDFSNGNCWLNQLSADQMMPPFSIS